MNSLLVNRIGRWMGFRNPRLTPNSDGVEIETTGKDGIMEIEIQCTDGDTSRFSITDERVCLALIESIRPSELFHQQVLRIQTGKKTSIFNMKAVESIYFATLLKAKIREQPPAKELRTISEKEYLESMDAHMRQYESKENIFEPGQSVDTLLALHCISGKTHYLQAEVIAKLRVEQLMELQNLLERLTSVIPCSPEGYVAINPANIKRIEIYPAPPETLLTAWLVN